MSSDITLLYAPAIYQGDTDRAVISECFQYQWFEQLFYFLVKSDVNVIWKVGRHNHMKDPMKFFKADNIRYSDRSIHKEMKKADLVLVDNHSSTIVLDAAKARKPCLVLLLGHRELALQDLYKECHVFESKFKPIEDSFKAIDDFIAGKLDVRGGLTLNQTDWLGVLKGDKNEWHKSKNVA